MKKSISFLCLLMCIVLAVSGCGSKKNNAAKDPTKEISQDIKSDEDNASSSVGNSDDSSASSDKTETADKPSRESDDSYIGADGRFIYRVIYQNDAMDIAVDEAKNLKAQIGETFDISVYCKADTELAEQKGYAEILIGNTDRSESAEALKLLEAKRVDYVIQKIGNKICVVASKGIFLARAVRKLNTEYFTSGEKFKKITQSFLIYGNNRYANSVADIAGVNISKYTFVTPEKMSLLYSLKPTELANLISEDYGYFMRVQNGSDVKSTYEIILCDASSLQNGALSENEYRILQKGTKLFVEGGSDSAVSEALDYLIALEKDCAERESPFVIKAGFVKIGAVSKKSRYNLVWADEFNAEKLDTDMWKTIELTETNAIGGKLTRTPIEDIKLRDGNLVLTSERLNAKDSTSSSVETSQSMKFRYGLIESRFKFGPKYISNGFGLMALMDSFEYRDGKFYDSFVSDGKPGLEIDIVENFCSNTGFKFNIHKWRAGGTGHGMLDAASVIGTKDYEYSGPGTLSDDFHIFSLLWTPYEMRVAVDGKVFCEIDMVSEGGWDYTRQPLPVLLYAGFAEAGYGDSIYPDDMPYYNETLFDYVRLYQCGDYDNIFWKP